MNKTLYFASALTLTFCTLAVESAAYVKTTATTRDDSTIKGMLTTDSFNGGTFFSDNLSLPPQKIANITFLQTNGAAKVLLTNGDTFSYAVSNRDVTISSLLGELKIPCSTLRSLTFENPQSRDTSSGIVFACDFESEAETPNFSGGSIVEGKFGNALHVPPRTSAAKVELPAGSIGRQGTIEFWGRIDKGAYMTTGGCPRFFEIINMDTKHEISQDWNANNGEAGYGLTFRMDGLPAMVSSHYGNSTYESLLGDPTAWHHYAIVWDAEGLRVKAPTPISVRNGNTKPATIAPLPPKAAVFIDGRCVMSTTSESWTGPALSQTSATLFFPNRLDEMPWYGRTGYSIDSFKLWNVAHTVFPH